MARVTLEEAIHALNDNSQALRDSTQEAVTELDNQLGLVMGAINSALDRVQVLEEKVRDLEILVRIEVAGEPRDA